MVEKQCQEQAYALLRDGGSDLGAEHKHFALLVRVFDEDTLQVKTRFLDMPACDSATGEGMSDKILASTQVNLLVHTILLLNVIGMCIIWPPWSQ